MLIGHSGLAGGRPQGPSQRGSSAGRLVASSAWSRGRGLCVQGLLFRVGLTVNTTEPGEETHRGSRPQHCDSEQGGSASGRPGPRQELEVA